MSNEALSRSDMPAVADRMTGSRSAIEKISARDAEIVAAAIRRRRLIAVLPWLVIAGALITWELSVWLFSIPEFVLPAPTVIAASMSKWASPLFLNSLATLKTTLIGFVLANVLGLSLGVIIGSSTLVYHGLYPLLIAFNSIPKVALVPILIIWFGIGTGPAILTAFLISFFPIMVNVAAGIATVEPELRDVMRALGAGPLKIVRKIGLPRSMPYYFASLKIAITSSFLGSILAETIGGQSGIGYLMMVAASRFEVPLVFAGVVVTAAMSVTMYALATLVETRTISWATRSQGDQGVAGV
jgi:NitT/TauT family transport system permease protein